MVMDYMWGVKKKERSRRSPRIHRHQVTWLCHLLKWKTVLRWSSCRGKVGVPSQTWGIRDVHETSRRRCSETELWLPHLSLSCVFTSSTGSSCQPSLSSPFHPFRNTNIKTSYSLDRALCSSYCSHPRFLKQSKLTLSTPHCNQL